MNDCRSFFEKDPFAAGNVAQSNFRDSQRCGPEHDISSSSETQPRHCLAVKILRKKKGEKEKNTEKKKGKMKQGNKETREKEERNKEKGNKETRKKEKKEKETRKEEKEEKERERERGRTKGASSGPLLAR